MQNLTLISGSLNTGQDILAQLNNYFHDHLNIRCFSTIEGLPLNLDSGVYLFSSKEVYNEAEKTGRLPVTLDVIIGTRTFDFTKFKALTRIPKGAKVLLVNDSMRSAVDTVEKLFALGLDDLEWLLCYPDGPETPKDIVWAVTPNEMNYVPDLVKNTINIGSRILDAYTLTLVMEKFSLRHVLEFDLEMDNVKELLNFSRNLFIENRLKTQEELKIQSAFSDAILPNHDVIDIDNILIFSGCFETSQGILKQLKTIISEDFNALCHSIDNGYEPHYVKKLIVFSSIEIYYEAMDHGIEFTNCEMIYSHRAPSFEMLEKLFEISPEHHILLINDSKISTEEGLESLQSYGFNFPNITLGYPPLLYEPNIRDAHFDVAVIFGEAKLVPLGMKVIDLGYRVLDHFSIIKLLVLLGLDDRHIRTFTNDLMQRAFQFMSLSSYQNKIILEINDKLEISYFETVKAMALAIDAKDRYTGGHCERVMNYALMIGEAMALDEMDMKTLKYSSILHDAGKIAIPDSILNKPDKFTEAEYELIKKHSQIGSDMIKEIAFLQDSSDVILDHHEWIDGNGYPLGKCEAEIHPLSKIISVVDAYDAMTSIRPYRFAPMNQEMALAELKRFSGSQFDRHVVDCLESLLLNR